MSQRLLDTYRVLCITPDNDVRKEVSCGMRKYGYEVTTVESRTGALQRYGHLLNFFHVILIDDDIIGAKEGPGFSKYLREKGYDGQLVVATYCITPGTEIPYRDHNIHSYFRKQPMDVARLAAYLIEKK